MRRLLLIACFVLPATMALAQTAPPPPSTPPATGRPSGIPPPGVVGPQTPSPEQGRGQMPQTPPPAQGRGQLPTPTPPMAAPGQPAPGNWQNVKLDVTISDSLTAEMQTKRTVSMMIADGRNGQVRSSSSTGASINIDASPTIRQADGRILLRLTIEYQPHLTGQQLEKAGTSRTSFSQSLSLIVQDGRAIVAAQSADPQSDRKVSLEILATIQK